MNRKYYWENGRCLINCIANLYWIHPRKVPDLYGAKNRKKRKSLLYNRSLKKHNIKIIIIDCWLNLLLPLWYHIRVGKAVTHSNWNILHAVIYDGNELVYDPNHEKGNLIGIVPNWYEYYLLFDWLTIKE